MADSKSRENELQNQLLDVQENYGALSQRHAKLVSELAKGRNEGRAELLARLEECHVVCIQGID